MTDTEKMLALAMAVFPERDVAENGLDGRTWITTIDGAPSPWVPFDPANNSDQAIEVWCWLTCVCGASDETGMIGVLDSPRLYFLYRTPAEWRAAVRKAAMRVVG